MKIRYFYEAFSYQIGVRTTDPKDVENVKKNRYSYEAFSYQRLLEALGHGFSLVKLYGILVLKK